MKNIEVVKHQRKLNNLFSKIEDLSEDLELQAHWARYLCVLTSGFLETSIQAIFSNFTQKTASPKVANFVENKLKEFQNPKMEKILLLIKLFSSEWESLLRNRTEGELKDAVDSIVNNRNKIAHGDDVGITYARMYNYYKNAVTVIELIENQCNV